MSINSYNYFDELSDKIFSVYDNYDIQIREVLNKYSQ